MRRKHPDNTAAQAECASMTPSQITAPREPPSSRYRFFELHGELRNKIYSFVLFYPDGFTIDFTSHGAERKRHCSPFNALLICKRFRDECEELFFKRHELRFEVALPRDARTSTSAMRKEIGKLARTFQKTVMSSRLAHKLQRVCVVLGTIDLDHHFTYTVFGKLRQCLLRLGSRGARVRLMFELRSQGFQVAYDVVVSTYRNTERRTHDCFQEAFIKNPSAAVALYSRFHLYSWVICDGAICGYEAASKKGRWAIFRRWWKCIGH